MAVERSFRHYKEVHTRGPKPSYSRAQLYGSSSGRGRGMLLISCMLQLTLALQSRQDLTYLHQESDVPLPGSQHTICPEHEGSGQENAAHL